MCWVKILVREMFSLIYVLSLVRTDTTFDYFCMFVGVVIIATLVSIPIYVSI